MTLVAEVLAWAARWLGGSVWLSLAFVAVFSSAVSGVTVVGSR